MDVSVSLSHPEGGECVRMDLPASYDALTDTLERIHSNGMVRAYGKFHQLCFFEPTEFNFGVCNLFELNYLATKLTALDFSIEGNFVGAVHLLRHEMDLPKAINIACNVAEVGFVDFYCVKNEVELAEFHLENALVPELEDTPDSIYDWILEYTDYQKLGEAYKKEDNGVFLADGYLVVTHELRPLYDGNFEPPTPEPAEEQRSGMTYGGMSL